MDHPAPAETCLQLLFKKLHPHLEDAAHALATGKPRADLEKLHAKLLRAREEVCDLLEEVLENCEDELLAEHLAELADNLTPVGENFQQSLTLTQLCLEEAPAELLPFVPAGCEGASWRKRLDAFLAQLEQPAFQAKARWAGVDPEIGEEGEFS